MQCLPFELLQWENFERLCYRLAGQDADVEFHSLYGRAGQAQQGIDIYARKRNGKYNTWQSKRYKKYTASDLKKNIAIFTKNEWLKKSDKFYIAIQCSVDDVTLQDAIEKEAKALGEKNIKLHVLGGYDLSSILRKHPDIVLEFFGRICAEHFFGDTVDPCLLTKLDGAEFAKVRSQLLSVYSAGFELLDRIPVDAPSPLSDFTHSSIALLDRFSPPDILIRENLLATPPTRSPEALAIKEATLQTDDFKKNNNTEDGRQVEQLRRTALPLWLSESNRIAIIGNAGSGKSTVLRCLSLDLLGKQNVFPAVAQRWGRHLPLFISFAKWVRLTEASAGTIGIKDLLRASWQQQLTVDMIGLIDKAIDESRVVLFIDGLDEWSNEQAARTTLQAMLTIIAAHKIPVIVSARPRGLTKIGVIPEDWMVGLLAPLSTSQQRDIATIWFARNTDVKNREGSPNESIVWKTDRFFRELNKGRGLATLAETPLLLLGLIALAIRRQILPINKVQALNQLTDVLLEVHPHSRATAAGDVVPRFSAAANTEVRRDALAALAFEMRMEGGDAGYPLNTAHKCIKRFLSDSDGYAYPSDQAGIVAREILAVNSETIGLIVEKGPQEVGFAHASLEEYLASVHIQSWPIDSILRFVRSQASSIRWRSVFADLIATTRRRSEAEQIVSVIDEYESDAVGALQRRLLLAEVCFGAAEIHKATAERLANRSINIIEGSGWLGEQTGHLTAALEGIYNPSTGAKLSKLFDNWGIRRSEYLSEFYKEVRHWNNSDLKLRILQRGLSDESSYNRRSAAQSLAAAYAGNSDVENWLEDIFKGDTNLGVVAVALEALITGWPENPQISRLIKEASESRDKIIKLSSIWCKVKLNQHIDSDLEALLDLLDNYAGIDYHHREWAGTCLATGWPNNQDIITICINSLQRLIPRNNEIDRDAAIHYLLKCDEHNPPVIHWIKSELTQPHPFSSMLHGDWSPLIRFAKANETIRENLISHIISGKMDLQEYSLRAIFEQIEDNRLKDHLIKKTREAEGFSIFWNFAPLIQGWAAKDSEVIRLSKEVLTWPDDKKLSITSLLPLLMNSDECRKELLRLTVKVPKARTDLIISAFSQLNCADNNEIIEALLLRVTTEPDTIFSGKASLIARFPKHPKIRQHALKLLTERDAPYSLLARAYRDDLEIQNIIMDQVTSLATPMRQIIIEAAANEFDRNDGARRLLERYDYEADGELKVQCSIRYYQALNSEHIERAPIIEQLLGEATAVGHKHFGLRAAAFAGMTAFGAINYFVPLQWGDKPLGIPIGVYNRENQALLRLMAEHWSELLNVFEEQLLERITAESTSIDSFWNVISPHISSNPKLRHSFIEYCASTETILELQTLRALARELPKSDLLREKCLLALNTTNKDSSLQTWGSYQSYFEAAHILKDQFSGDSDILSQLSDGAKRSDYKHCVAALAIYAPETRLLDSITSRLSEAVEKYQAFCTPIIVAAAKSNCDDFLKLLSLMINRPHHSTWDFQDRINSAVRGRIISDHEISKHIKQTLEKKPTESEIASLSRYLVSTGHLDQKTYELCQSLLNQRNTYRGIPFHGFDAIMDTVRPVTHSLLDVLASPVG